MENTRGNPAKVKNKKKFVYVLTIQTCSGAISQQIKKQTLKIIIGIKIAKNIETVYYIFYLDKLRNIVIKLTRVIKDLVNVGEYKLVYKNQWFYIYKQ